MAIGGKPVSCTIVLHDDRVTTDKVLCGSRVLPKGCVATLLAKGAKPLVIASTASTRSQDELSIHVSLGQRFGLENRTAATVQLIEDVADVTATHVEFFFRDQYLSRADIWRLMRELDEGVLYKGQQVRYLGLNVATVEAMYISGRSVDSAVLSHALTKPIFRSGSARFTILIEVSKEMLETWSSGYLMYELLISGYLVELFRRWEETKVKHQVTLILFGRTYACEKTASSAGSNDFYHVLEADASAALWPELLHKLKRAFHDASLPRQVTLASQSNIIEAFHLAVVDFMEENTDLRLQSTGSSIIAVTAGSGSFDANYEMLKRTTHLLMGNSIGVDLVSLAQKPLHPGPLFRYKQDDQWKSALPHWLDISYWSSTSGIQQPRWPLGEREASITNVTIPLLQLSGPSLLADSPASKMNTYDAQLFHGLLDKPRRATFALKTESLLFDLNRTAAPSDCETPGKSVLGVELHASDSRSSTESPITRPSKLPIRESKVKSKKESVAHPLLKTSRTISLGPKGLAPGRGAASTTISVQHAGQEKDVNAAALTPRSESSADLAKQIRASLVKKPSQQSLLSMPSPSSLRPTKPIDIHTGIDARLPDVEGLTALEESDNEQSQPRHLPKGGGSLSRTPNLSRTLSRSRTIDSVSSAQQQMAPWVTLLNPCNPRRDNMQVASQYRKWQHVFPKAISSGAFKWTSMCSPAMLPITTEYRPSEAELDKDYRTCKRRILQLPTQNARAGTAESLIDDLIVLRLIRGFQIVIERSQEGYVDPKRTIERALLSKGNRYHELRRIDAHSVEIVEHELKMDGSGDSSKRSIQTYKPRVLSQLCHKSRLVSIDMNRRAKRLEWDKIDDQLMHTEQPTHVTGISRARYVLIPVELNRHDSWQHAKSKELSDDERRIDGIQRLTQLWQRHRIFSVEERNHLASLARPKAPAPSADRDPNPLAIEYLTRDPSVVAQVYGPSVLTVNTGTATAPPLFAESELYHSSNYDTSKLVKQMQEEPPRGIEVKDRRWFTRVHPKCFRGDELTNWLLRVFKDLSLRDDAVALGNDLMKRGIFTHVRHKHDFRDGNYFYQIAAAYRTTDYPDTAGLFGKTSGRTIPPTPSSDTRSSPGLRPARGDSASSNKQSSSSDRGDGGQLLLSRVLQYNVGQRKTSKDGEVVNLHYDRIHNPENCYHIQLDWIEATANLVRESINRWAALVDGYGLKLVQVPIIEAGRLRENHAFDQPYMLKLAKDPPSKSMATPALGPYSPTTRPIEDGFGYHKALLRKFDFVLDLEAADAFGTSVEVLYSWGKPGYTLTQFVHRSGLLLAQISANASSDFLILSNRLAFSRPTASAKQQDTACPFQIMKAMSSFCHDAHALTAFYEEANKPRLGLASPMSNASYGMDHDVPPMQLPPHILQRIQI